jgi:O-antigen ligase
MTHHKDRYGFIFFGIVLCALGFLPVLLRVRRPEILSLGTMSFAVGCIAALLSGLLFLACMKAGPDRDLLAPVRLDAAFAAAVAVSLVSFLASAKQPSNMFQPLLLFTGFLLYLFVRVARRRVLQPHRRAIVRLLAGVAAIAAVQGLAQSAAGHEMKGVFFNVNHFAMFLATVLPLSLGLLWEEKRLCARLLSAAASGLMLTAIAFSRCRTSYIALILALGLMFFVHHPRLAVRRQGRPGTGAAYRAVLAVGTVAFLVAAGLGLSFKQMSAAGRLLIWRVASRMVIDRPLEGVGFSNFSSFYNLAQGRFFASGKGTAIERLSAAPGLYAFNDYLETAVDLGIVGLIAFGIFWGLALARVIRIFRRHFRGRIEIAGSPASDSTPGQPPPAADALALGTAGSVLAYMIMAFFYYPSRIFPVFLLFTAFLAWIAGEGSGTDRPLRSSRPAGRLQRIRLSRPALALFSLAAFLGSILLLPTLHRQFSSEREWSRARSLTRDGRAVEAVALCRHAYPGLRSNENFLIFYGRLLTGLGMDDEAAVVFERRAADCPNPYLLEKLAAARLKRGALDAALAAARSAESILPWRLTSKSLLSEIYEKKKDPENAARYARMVLETPMKVRTPEGESLKARALGQWARFDKNIRDREGARIETVFLLPPAYRMDALDALAMAGPASARYVDAIREADPEERTCLAFLLANMPEQDLRSIAPGDIVENARLALRARRTVPVAEGVPESIFLEYVLPYAAADEAFEKWRPGFYDRFLAAALTSPTIEEAVMRLNRDVFVGFELPFQEKETRHPLSGPLASLKMGAVSCAEASLLLVDACRSVGIPARMVFLPRYSWARGGHAWVEVFDSGKWRHISAYDPAFLDRTWITVSLAKLVPSEPEHRIYTVRFRRTARRFSYGPEGPLVDITESYVK